MAGRHSVLVHHETQSSCDIFWLPDSDVHDGGILGQITYFPWLAPLDTKMSYKPDLLIAILCWLMTFGLIAAIIANGVR
jgi:hypothetical protein